MNECMVDYVTLSIYKHHNNIIYIDTDKNEFFSPGKKSFVEKIK